MTIEDLARIPQMRNIYTKIFLRGANLADFYFIGFQEHFDEEILKLKAMLGWRDIPFSHKNKNDYADYDKEYGLIKADTKLMSTLVSLNAQDIDIYNKALSLRANTNPDRP
jgi:hypothetical protein